jgi:uncharacterized protein (TIGR03435 family)
MITDVTNHLWQSTVFAIVAAGMTLTLRRNRAQVRYRVWLCASVKFLVPFAVLVSLGSMVQFSSARTVATRVAVPAVSLAVEQIAEPFPVVWNASAVEPGFDWMLFAIAAVWACGVVAIVFVRVRGWLLVRDAVRSSLPWACASDSFRSRLTGVDVRSSGGLLEPGVVGLFRPVLLLPAGMEEHLTSPQLEAVLAHELCHIRRRDNLTSAVHMIVEAIFWFHPLVWWVGARMVEERERACDEEVLRLGNDPSDYAEGILNVCKRYVESPLVCVSGVTGAELKIRIEAIMANRGVFQLHAAKKWVLAAAGIAAIALPLSVGVLRAQEDGLLGDLGKYSFEVATIRPGKPDQGKMMGIGTSGRPGRWEGTGVTVQDLILAAYGGTGGSLPKQRLVGGPKWMESSIWDVLGQAPEGQTEYRLLGKMLQTLLRERFHLRVHTEQRPMPVFALTVSKPGKLTQSKADCMAQIAKGVPSSELPDVCGLGTEPGEPRRLRGGSVTMAQLAQLLGTFPSVGRNVMDKTGLKGMWDFDVAFMPADRDGVESPIAPPIITAIQEQLGLKLESDRAPVEVLVVDQVEMPSEN